MKVIFGILVWLGFLNLTAQAQTMDYLQVPGPVKFHDENFFLAWSSHPSETYFKQEYVRKGEKVESFKEMVLLEFLTGDDLKAEYRVSAKIQELRQLKDGDPFVSFELIERPDKKEVIIDFIVRTRSFGATEIVEWNAYRYKTVKDVSGKNGVILLGISRRAYGKEIKEFMTTLETSRVDYRNALIEFTLPAVNISK